MNKGIPVSAFNKIFFAFAAIFLIACAIAVYQRGGKDLKVGLYGVVQTLHRQSPYDNYRDPERPLFRYAPVFALMQYPFLLESEMTAPFEFQHIGLSCLAWYFTVALSLFVSGRLLLKIVPAASFKISERNLKIGFLMAAPLIAYELTNGQNKLLALCFMLAAIFFFEQDKLFPAAVFFNLALVVYVALLPFIIYFLIKRRRFIFYFFLGVMVVFLIFPSLVFGLKYNLYLLYEWWTKAIKPFFITNSYTTYVDLRRSSQALPSAIGRMLAVNENRQIRYFLAPELIHIVIRFCAAIIVLISSLAVYKNSRPIAKGLACSIFLMLALLLPQYCIYYTWSWIFVFYYAVLNYISYDEVMPGHKRLLVAAVLLSYLSICLIGVNTLKSLSFLFWSTLILWGGMVTVMIRERYQR